MFLSPKKVLNRLICHNRKCQLELSTNHVRALSDLGHSSCPDDPPTLSWSWSDSSPTDPGITALATTSPHLTMSAISAVQCRFLAGAKVSAARKTVKARAAVVAPVAKLGCVPRLKETPSDDARACFSRRESALGRSTDSGDVRRGRPPVGSLGCRKSSCVHPSIRVARAPGRYSSSRRLRAGSRARGG